MALLKLAISILAIVLGIQAHTFQGFAPWAPKACCTRDISARHSEFMSLGGAPDKTIYWWNGTVYKSTLTGAGVVAEAVSVSASPDGWHWCIGMVIDQVFRWNNGTKLWERQTMNQGPLSQISAMSKDKILIRRADNSLASCWSNGTCTNITGTASWVSVGQNDERWMVGYPDNQVWRWNQVNGNWDQMPGENAKRIDVLGPNAVALVAQNNTAYLWEYGHWSPIQGSNCEYVTLDTGKMWCSHAGTDIYYGEFRDPYPSAPITASGSLYQSPDMNAPMGSGQCEVIIECPYLPALAPSSCT